MYHIQSGRVVKQREQHVLLSKPCLSSSEYNKSMKEDEAGCKYSSAVTFPRSSQIRLLTVIGSKEKVERLNFLLVRVSRLVEVGTRVGLEIKPQNWVGRVCWKGMSGDGQDTAPGAGHEEGAVSSQSDDVAMTQAVNLPCSHKLKDKLVLMLQQKANTEKKNNWSDWKGREN